MRVWRSSPGRAIFDLQAPKKLTQHTGPVSSMALSNTNIFSGSWDYSVRVWSRATLQQLALLSFPDWVDCLTPRWVNLMTTLVGLLESLPMVSSWRTSWPKRHLCSSRGRCLEVLMAM